MSTYISNSNKENLSELIGKFPEIIKNGIPKNLEDRERLFNTAKELLNNYDKIEKFYPTPEEKDKSKDMLLNFMTSSLFASHKEKKDIDDIVELINY